MDRCSDLKLIDLLSMRPGSLLRPHAVKGDFGCMESETLSQNRGWREEISHAIFPQGDSIKIHNFSKLLDIPLSTQILIRHPDGKVVEILRLKERAWETVLERAGNRADVLVNGRVIARGEIVNTAAQSGILITTVAALS